MPEPLSIHPLSVHNVTLAVRDLAATTRFYRDVIGLQPLEADADEAWLGAGGQRLLRLRARPDARPRDPAAAGLFHTAFLLPTMADLGRWLRHVEAIGLRLDGMADHLVSNAFYLHDPEDNGIEVYADRPRDTWRWQDGTVQMANDRPDVDALTALDPRPWDGAPPGTRIGHVHLQVGDIAQAEPFYAGTIGLAVTSRWPKAMFLSSGGYHHHIAVNTWRSAGAGPRDPAQAGLAEIALRTAGPAQPPLADPWGTTITFVGDTA